MNIRKYIQALWYKKKYSLKDYLVLFFLWPVALCYRLGFSVVMAIKRKKGQRRCSWFNVISVGNLSVGGTGKTVFVQFLLSLLAAKRGGVVLRGYRGEHSSRYNALVVSDGKQLFASVEQCGDEAFMLACDSKVPVAICKNRLLACKALAAATSLDYVILDDAYQNVDVQKDIEMLLVDARYPLWRASSFPMGFLREKNYKRADIIILTHAASITQQQHDEWVSFFSGMPNVFSGRNVSAGIFLHNQGGDVSATLLHKRVLVIAGIGNISGFVQSVKHYGICVAHVIDFGDHHSYSNEDISALVAVCRQLGIESIVTTSKDWYKLVSLLRYSWHSNEEKIIPNIYVLHVKFEFLSQEQYDHFHLLVDKMLG